MTDEIQPDTLEQAASAETVAEEVVEASSIPVSDRRADPRDEPYAPTPEEPEWLESRSLNRTLNTDGSIGPCTRCGHVWFPRVSAADPTRLPKCCARCRSTQWDVIPRVGSRPSTQWAAVESKKKRHAEVARLSWRRKRLLELAIQLGPGLTREVLAPYLYPTSMTHAAELVPHPHRAPAPRSSNDLLYPVPSPYPTAAAPELPTVQMSPPTPGRTAYARINPDAPTFTERRSPPPPQFPSVMPPPPPRFTSEEPTSPMSPADLDPEVRRRRDALLRSIREGDVFGGY